MSATDQITISATGGIGATASGTHRIETPLQFLAQSVVVNNYTNQWIFLPDANLFVPPYTLGFTVNATGVRKLFAFVDVPPGIPQTAIIVGQRCNLEAFDGALPPSPGQTIVVRAPSTEWRNPLGLAFASITAFAGTVPFSADFTYTVPAGRRARIDTCQVAAEIFASDGSGSGTNMGATISFFPLGGGGSDLVAALIHTGTVQGARADAALAAGKELQAGDVVQGQSGNLRGAGVTLEAIEFLVITEGDA